MGDGFIIGAVQFAADASQKTPGKQIERKRAFFFFHFADKTIQRAVGIGNGRFGGSFFKDVNGRQNGIEDAVDVGVERAVDVFVGFLKRGDAGVGDYQVERRRLFALQNPVFNLSAVGNIYLFGKNGGAEVGTFGSDGV